MDEIGIAEPEPFSPPLWPVVGCGLLVFSLTGLFWSSPPCRLDRAQGQLTGCKSNCKNLAMALEMYASSAEGRYPRSLYRLTASGCLKTLPTCPAAGEMTYRNYRMSMTPDAFSFSCCGNHHGRAYTGFGADSTNYPRYHAELGLLDHP